jgi:hypothetical protein
MFSFWLKPVCAAYEPAGLAARWQNCRGWAITAHPVLYDSIGIVL